MALGHLVWITVSACFILISSLNTACPLILSFCSLCLNTLLLQLLTCGWTLKRANTPGKLSYHCVFTDKAGSERWKQVLHRCRWTLRLSVVLSVSLAEVQNFAWSKPNRMSTVKLHSWFDCSSLLCRLQCWQICQKSGFLYLLLCIRCPMVDFAWGRYVHGFVNCVCTCVCVCVHFPNKSDLKLIWMTALTRYWKLHTGLIGGGALITSFLIVYICYVKRMWSCYCNIP